MVAEIIHKTKDVFGLARSLPLNYVERDGIDDLFIKSLNRQQHLVIYGSSKQGKTCLRKKCLNSDDHTVIHCSNRWTIMDINTQILKNAGFEIISSISRTKTGVNRITAKIPITTFDTVNEDSETLTTRGLEIELNDVNDIIHALETTKFNKYIVLEDFHYLPVEVQKDFAIELKAFHENSNYCFIIVGVWLEENRLISHNGDLTGRVIPINADHWSEKNLHKVIEAGEQLLNIQFDSEIKSEIVNKCMESVFILQETCYLICEKYNIHQTCDELYEISKSDIDIDLIIRSIVHQQSSRYNSFITNFADGFQQTQLEMHKWLLYPVLSSSVEQLEKGIKYSEIKRVLQEHHPKMHDLNLGNLTQALKSTTSLQVKKNIMPIILDYDETNLKLHIVDKGFLIWFTKQDKNDLMEFAGF